MPESFPLGVEFPVAPPSIDPVIRAEQEFITGLRNDMVKVLVWTPDLCIMYGDAHRLNMRPGTPQLIVEHLQSKGWAASTRSDKFPSGESRMQFQVCRHASRISEQNWPKLDESRKVEQPFSYASYIEKKMRTFFS